MTSGPVNAKFKGLNEFQGGKGGGPREMSVNFRPPALMPPYLDNSTSSFPWATG